MIYILYNPKSGDSHSKDKAGILAVAKKEPSVIRDITLIDDYHKFASEIAENDTVILCGGDGTLNRFVNNMEGIDINFKLFYYPTGSGNDFAHDLNHNDGDEPFQINHFIKNLPTVEINGKRYRFLNNVSFGIDAYCCERGEEHKLRTSKPTNYTLTAIKAFLFEFMPRNATVTVDGVTKKYSKVWLAPAMKGRYFGGGMKAAPSQDRLNPDNKLSFLALHGVSTLKALTILPKVFTGDHVKHTEAIDILCGHEITVTFDIPTSIAIDGEPLDHATTFTARS